MAQVKIKIDATSCVIRRATRNKSYEQNERNGKNNYFSQQNVIDDVIQGEIDEERVTAEAARPIAT